MDGPTYVTLSAQIALQNQLDVTANNVANANTAGYKPDRMLFQSMVAPLDVPGRNVAFVQDRATYMDRTAGAFQVTDNPLDTAIQGEGYIAVRGPQGTMYSRDGRLQISPQGTLVDQAGRAVVDSGGAAIQIPDGASDIKILGDGTLSVRANGVLQEVGQIGLFKSATPDALLKTGSGLIDGAAGGMQPLGPGDPSVRLVQGSIETSGVQPVRELANMTQLTQAYARLQKLISDDNDRERSMIEQLGKTN